MYYASQLLQKFYKLSSTNVYNEIELQWQELEVGIISLYIIYTPNGENKIRFVLNI